MKKIIVLAVIAAFLLGFVFPSPGAFPDTEYQAFFKATGISQEEKRVALEILQQAVWDIQDNVTADWMEVEVHQFDRLGTLRALLRLSRAKIVE